MRTPVSLTMRQYLVEGLTGAFPFIVDRSKLPVVESQPNGGVIHRIPGRFSVCDCVNGNNRRYSRNVWEKNLTPGSPLQESIKRNGAFGLLEHPKDGVVTLQSPISHQVVKAELIESIGADGKKIHEVVGEIALYNPALIPESGKLLGLIEGGYNPLVSSRGYGSLKKGDDGVDNVEEDYVCESWDVVIKPSFENAELTPARAPLSTTAATLAAPAKASPTAESAPASSAAPITYTLYMSSNGVTTQMPVAFGNPAGVVVEQKNLKESPSAVPLLAAPASPPKQINIKRMEINEIRTRVSTLRSMEPTKLARFAESMSQIEAVHQDIAEWAAAEPKRAWEAQKMHKELDTIAEDFTNVARQPVKQAKHLTEQNGKLMRVVNAVAATALTYKKKLGEAVKAATSAKKMVEELTRRGQGWQRLAESRKDKFLALEKDFDTSCEALDLMAKRYHEDCTELGRRVIVLEFKEKAQTPEIQKQLKEATRLRHIAAIRETLEPKKDVAEAEACKQPPEGETPSKEGINDRKQKDAGSPEQGKVAAEPGKVKTESADAAKKQPVTEAAPTARVLSNERDVRDVSESVGLVKRLSGNVK
jgi:Prohead core protein serine protease